MSIQYRCPECKSTKIRLGYNATIVKWQEDDGDIYTDDVLEYELESVECGDCGTSHTNEYDFDVDNQDDDEEDED
jgi:hypothetical protein